MTREHPLTGRARPDRSPHTLEDWRKLGGYEAVERGLKMTPEQVLDMVEDANLNGRGGAGFPAAKKWRFMPKPGQSPGDGPSYFIVNGDEMEPGAFKDRILLEAVPHQLIEGAILSAYATHSSEIIVLIRDAYPRPHPPTVTPTPIAKAEGGGYPGARMTCSLRFD